MREYISKPNFNRAVLRFIQAILLALLVETNLGAADRAASDASPVKRETLAAAGEYRIQPFDLLDINVYRESDLCVKLRVNQTGNINYPLLGSVAVSGLTASEAQDKLAKLLDKGYLVNPRVTVSVEASSTRKVMIFGQVKSPGAYEIPTSEPFTVLQAVARAGGFTDIAATDRVAVIRGEGSKQKKIIVNISAIMKGGDKAKDIVLEPGDIVSVPETMF